MVATRGREVCCAALDDESNPWNDTAQVTRRRRDAGRPMRTGEAAGTPVRIHTLHSVGSRRLAKSAAGAGAGRADLRRAHGAGAAARP